MITNRAISFTIPGIASEVDDQLSRAIDIGIAYEGLEKSEGFALLMDSLRLWAVDALRDLQTVSPDADDRTVRLLQLRWKEREALIQHLRQEIVNGKLSGAEAAKQLQIHGSNVGPMMFGSNDGGGD